MYGSFCALLVIPKNTPVLIKNKKNATASCAIMIIMLTTKGGIRVSSATPEVAFRIELFED